MDDTDLEMFKEIKKLDRHDLLIAIFMLIYATEYNTNLDVSDIIEELKNR